MTSSRGTVVDIDDPTPIFINHHANESLKNAEAAAREALMEHFDFG